MFSCFLIALLLLAGLFIASSSLLMLLSAFSLRFSFAVKISLGFLLSSCSARLYQFSMLIAFLECLLLPLFGPILV